MSNKITREELEREFGELLVKDVTPLFMDPNLTATDIRIRLREMKAVIAGQLKESAEPLSKRGS